MDSVLGLREETPRQVQFIANILCNFNEDTQNLHYQYHFGMIKYMDQNCINRINLHTLPDTNSSHLKIWFPKRKRSDSKHPFSGANLLLVSRRVNFIIIHQQNFVACV